MWKGIAIGGAALAIAGSAFVMAQAQTQLFQPQQRPGVGQPAVPGAPGTTMLMDSEPGAMRGFGHEGRRGFGEGRRGFGGERYDREHFGGERMGRLSDDAKRAFDQVDSDDRRAFTEARLAALKAGLALTPEQERNWPAFEQAARDFAKMRSERRQAWRDWQPAKDPIEQLRRRGDRMSETGAVLKKLADAFEPLYKSFDEGQKRRFAMLSRFGRMLGMEGPRFELGGGGFRGGDRDGMGMRRWAPRRERQGDGDRRDNENDRDEDDSGKQKL
jgi:hypothetical protein